METKEFKIEIPEGYIIDISNSDLTKGIVKFTKIDTRPRSWEEFCKNYPVKKGETYIHYNNIFPIDEFSGCRSKNICTSKEEAEAFLALMQLRQLRKAWIGDWKDTYKNTIGPVGFSIIYDTSKCIFRALSFSCYPGILSFPTQEIAFEFEECFKDLLEKAKILL